MHMDIKNFESLQEHGKRKFYTSQDYFSYTGEFQKKKIIRKAFIMGWLSMLLGYCFTDEDLPKSFGFLLVDLFSRHFPKKVVEYLYYPNTHHTYAYTHIYSIYTYSTYN